MNPFVSPWSSLPFVRLLTIPARLTCVVAGIVGSFLLPRVSSAQEIPASLTKEDLARDNRLFLTLASKALKWEEPTEPVRIAGPLYFVGTKALDSFLFVTSEGNILFNTGMPSSGPMIVESIKKLGFKPEDSKLLINGHAHSDHAGAFAYLRN